MNENFNLEEHIAEVNKTVNYDLPRLSISQILGLLQEEFDSEGIAKKTHDKNFNNPESKYYKMSVEEIMEAWAEKGKESCKYGSLLDDYIGMRLNNALGAKLEMWKLDNNYDWDERLHGVCDSFDAFYDLAMKSGDTQFVSREKSLYYKVPDKDYYIKGRFDAIFRNVKTGKWIVVDWKSSGSVDKKGNAWTKKLFGPACKFPALNWYTYTMQTHFYKKALIEMGYLPEGTKEEDVTVLIVQLPGKIIESTGQNFEIHHEAFPFNSKLMDQIFDFAIKKNELKQVIQ